MPFDNLQIDQNIFKDEVFLIKQTKQAIQIVFAIYKYINPSLSYIFYQPEHSMYGQPPAYGVPYGQPGYIAPPPPAYGYGVPPPTGPTIIHINNDGDDGTPCQFCGSKTSHIARKSVGTVAIAWGCCLLWTTGWLCWLPCVMDGCKDVELVCVKCQNVKQTIPANCC